jgi:hypothetical protein
MRIRWARIGPTVLEYAGAWAKIARRRAAMIDRDARRFAHPAACRPV